MGEIDANFTVFVDSGYHLLPSTHTLPTKKDISTYGWRGARVNIKSIGTKLSSPLHKILIETWKL